MHINEATPQQWDKAAANPEPTTKEKLSWTTYNSAMNNKVEHTAVNNPPHYNTGNIECIDYLEDNLKEGFEYYLEGNVKKYLHRFRHKGSEVQDLRKALWYLNRLIDTLDPETS